MAIIKITSAGDVAVRTLLQLAGKYKMVQSLWKTDIFFKNRSTTPKYTPKKTENISNKDLYMNVHSDIIIAKK